MFEVGSIFSPADIDSVYIAGIYRIVMKDYNGAYVGESNHIPARWREHITQLDSGRHGCYGMQRDWERYGREQFRFEVLMHEEDLLTRLRLERAWILKQVIEQKSIYNERRVVSHAIRAYATLKKKGVDDFVVNYLVGGTWKHGKPPHSDCAQILGSVGVEVAYAVS